MTFDSSQRGTHRRARLAAFAPLAATLLAAPFGVLAADAASTASAQKVSVGAPGPNANAAQKHWSVIEKYCVECHNTTDWAGGIAFDSMTLDNIPGDAETWEKAIRRLRGRLMPPPGKPQPENEAISSLVTYLETSLDSAAAGHAHVGRVGLHRLNRREYANAVMDLLDLPIEASSILPRDEAHDGFDNIATALQVSPSFMDQYLGAAHKVAAQALGNASARPAATTYAIEGGGTQRMHRDGLPFGTRGGTVVDHFFPADGEYSLTIADLAGALWVHDMEFENTLVAMLDGQEFYRTHVGGEEDLKAIDQLQDPAVDAINKRLKNIRFQATAGVHKVGVTFLERTFAESDARLFSIAPEGGQDKVKAIRSFEVRGPFEARGVSLNASRKKIFSCYPHAESEEQACADQIVTHLATQAFRGELDAENKAGLMKLYAAGRKSGDFDSGIKRALAGILASPNFLYRADLQPSGPEQATRPLTDYELASRLSFFLWSSIPDDALLADAKAGRLQQPDVLARQVQRMLASPRSETLTTNFAFQWLNVARLDEITPDPRLFPYASGQSDVRKDFKEELRYFIDSVFRTNSNVLDLLSSDKTFVNEKLALHYGITTVKGDQFQPVTLTQSARFGLLGKGGVLMLTSYPDRTAPVLRGAWILERISGTPPGTPPPNVGNLKEVIHGKKNPSLRERMEEHSTNPRCFACHGVMDPLGFSLENFDAVGQYREMDRATRDILDTSGKLPDGTQVKGPDDLRKALLAKPEQFVQTLTQKLMTYGLGRPVEYSDMPTVRGIVRNLAANNYRFNELITQIVTSDAFLKTAPPPVDPKNATLQAAVNRQPAQQ
jgi:mono/diheme cytochrome c family protein